MRRYLAVAVGVLALLGVLAPPAFAQAPAPKVTIEGLVDQTMTYSKNMSIYDNDVTRDGDKSWTARVRGNLYITGEVGKVKAFTFLKHDLAYGKTVDSGALNAGAEFGVRDVALNSETQGAIDIVELYTEFPLTGEGSLLPFIPKPGLARVGIQNFDVDTYKLGALAWGFYAGLHAEVDLAPGWKFTNTYAQIEESVTGSGDIPSATRGDDYADIHGLEISGLAKGLNLKPIYAHFFADGTTSGNAGPRTGAGGVADAAPASGVAGFSRGMNENRHTIGIDSTWTSGPWSLAPTFFYQFGQRQMTPTVASGKKVGCGGTCVEQDMEAWLFDLQGGWQNGPLQLDGLFVYSPGNEAKEDLRAGRTVHYYQPIDTDAIYGVNWGEIVGITYDYKQQLGYSANAGKGSTSQCLSCNVSYDKYGRIQVGARVSYNVTPAFKLRGLVTSLWTAEDVDTRATVGSAGLTAARIGPNSKGNDSYLGTETDIGFEWRFAPNMNFAVIYAHMFTGDAMGNACPQNGCSSGSPSSLPSTATASNPKDIDAFTTMIRFVF